MVLCNTLLAQAPKKAAVLPMIKFKPPVVQSFLGSLTGNTVTSVADGKNAVSLSLKITDDKKQTYNISSYQFAYNRTGITEDEETGKTAPQQDVVTNHFTETPLPVLWQTNIKQNLHKGESLFFFDIIAIDKQGRRFFAPELKITIQ